MLRHPNLHESINRILEMDSDPERAVNLKTVKKGQFIGLQFYGESMQEIAFLIFEVIKPAGDKVQEDDALRATLEYGLFPRNWLKFFYKEGLKIPPIGEDCTIIGACTKNPGAPLGCTMIHFHSITVGRHLLWRMPRESEFCWIFEEEVAARKIMTQEQFFKIKQFFEESAEFVGLRFTEQAIEEIKQEVASGKREETAWDEFIKQSLVVTTKNSIYEFGPADENEKRTIHKRGTTEVKHGQLIFVKEGKSMCFYTEEDNKFWNSSLVKHIEPKVKSLPAKTS